MTDLLSPIFGLILLGGLAVGMALDRCVRRLTFAKSLWWPRREHCAHCLAPLAADWSVPLWGAVRYRGVCRFCQRPFPRQGWLIAPLTAGLAVALYRHYSATADGWVFLGSPWSFTTPILRALFVYHFLLFSFLIVATFVDINSMTIPDAITIPGMIVGVAMAGLWQVELHPIPVWTPPFPESWVSAESWRQVLTSGQELSPTLESVRLSLSQHLWLWWNRYLGVATSVVGLVAGGAIVWVVRWVTSWTYGREAIGFGDVTLMAMVGSFVGWQAAVIAFFLAPVSAVVVGVPNWIITGRGELPFGPHLAIATVFCVFFWQPLWQRFHYFFAAETSFLFATAVILTVALIVVAGLVQWCKRTAIRVWNTTRRT